MLQRESSQPPDPSSDGKLGLTERVLGFRIGNSVAACPAERHALLASSSLPVRPIGILSVMYLNVGLSTTSAVLVGVPFTAKKCREFCASKCKRERHPAHICVKTHMSGPMLLHVLSVWQSE